MLLVVGCSPEPAKVITIHAPTFEIKTNRPAVLDRRSRGCVGWNPATHRALCIVGSLGSQQGSDLRVRELGGDDDLRWLDVESGLETQQYPGEAMRMRPSSETLGAARAIVARDALVALPDFPRLLAPNTTLVVGSMKLRFTHDEPPNDAPVEDRIVVTRANGTTTELVARRQSGGVAADAKLYEAPGVILLEWAAGWAEEGDSGTSWEAIIIESDR